MKAKKDKEERKPDLNEAEDQLAIEQRIKDMMELEPKAAPVVSHNDKTPTAPDLPKLDKPLSIKIMGHDGTPELSEDETSKEVEEAIVKVNEQLLGETTDATDDIEAPEEKTGPETAAPDDASLVTETSNETTDATSDQSPGLGTPAERQPGTEDTLASEETAAVVDEIIKQESDDLLKAEDEKIAQAFEPNHKATFGERLRGLLRNKALRRALILLIVVGSIASALIPMSRYTLLNTVGVRSKASLTVLDESTRQPLKNVKVTLGNVTGQTDQEGQVQLDTLRLGSSELVIEKRAFAPITKRITIGWGSNPLGDHSLQPVGNQYLFTLTDFLSGKPVQKAEATSEDASAVSDEKGNVRLTIDQTDDHEREVTIIADGYREEKFKLDLNNKNVLPIELVPVRKHVFISKRSGRYDVFKVDIDGKNEKLVLPGTGTERDDMVLVMHTTEDVAALVSTRENKRNEDGFLLSTLNVMSLDGETVKAVAESERIQIIEWVGDRLVYVQVAAGTSAASPNRHRLMSFDYKSQDNKELAASNYFNDVMVANGKVYYAPSSTYTSNTKTSFYRVQADGSNRTTIINQEVWNIFRTSHDRLTLAAPQQWYEHRLGDNDAGKLSGEPPSKTSRVYIDSPDGSRSLWVDTRDGKGVLLAYDTDKKEDIVLRTQSGLKNPVRWINDSAVIFRVNTEQETADYALSIDGGEPKKIRDVTNTSGIDRWYYY